MGLYDDLLNPLSPPGTPSGGLYGELMRGTDRPDTDVQPVLGRGAGAPVLGNWPSAAAPDPLDSLADYLAPVPDTTYGTILPLASDQKTGDLRLALPSFLRDTGLGVVDLMRATAGQHARPLTDSDIPYTDPRMTPNAMTALGLIGAPGMASKLSRAPEEVMASRSARIYNPPVKSPRPFEADYPAGASSGAAGNLTADPEGHPLGARWLVGRGVVGGEDQAFPAAEYDALAEAATGRRSETAPARQMGSDAGRMVIDPATGQPSVYILNSLPADVAAKVLAHENAHVIDHLAGQIPTDGLMAELKIVYNDLNNPDLARARALNPNVDPWSRSVLRNYTPLNQGYRAAAAPRELMAEAIRAYMADPNYLKTVAPKTAAAIRAAVNTNPRLAKIIQFNAGPGLPGLGLTDDSSDR